MARRRAVQNEVYTIDPMFYIPEGMRDYVYGDNEALGLGDDESVIGFSTQTLEPDIFIVDDSEGEYDTEAPETPSNLFFLEQILRTMPDGTQVVDLIVEVEDIEAVSKYDFRVVKI